MEAFKAKTAKVVIVDQASSARLMMSSSLRAIGFADTVAVANLTEALGLLSKGPIDWLITSVFAEDKVNGLQILAMARQHQDLEGLRTSFMVNDADEGFLPRAYALGLLSAHRKSSSKTEFIEAMEGVLKNAEEQHWNDALTAAVYIRSRLERAGDLTKLVQFEAALAEKLPHEPRQLLNLAEAHFLNQENDRASSLLWQAEQRDPSLAGAARELAEKYLPGDAPAGDGAINPGIAVAIDSDPTALTTIKKILEDSGAKEVHTFSDGDAAWAWLKSHNAPDLIIMEWRIPKVSGPNLLQRIRSFGLHLPPVIVNSSLVGKKDQPLLVEMGVTTVLEKPTRRQEYVNGIAYTLTQARRPSERQALENRIRAHLAAGESEQAAALMQTYVAQDDSQDAARRHLEAEFAFHVGDYAAARELAMASLQLGGKSIVTLNLLGKALMKLNDSQAALKIFEKANEVSPNSIERLCAIAETQCALGDEETATATLDKATKMDSEHQAVINTTVNIALATGNSDMAAGVFDKVRPSDSVLAYINNRAVALAKAGNFKESIALYAKALSAIPQDKQAIRSIVLYNQALAQVQDGDMNAALASLKAVVERSDHGLASKIISLAERTEAAIKSGKPIKLNTRDAAEGVKANPTAAKFASILQKLAPPPPEGAKTACCAGIYRDTSSSPLIDAMLENLPRFTSWRS